MKKKGFTLIELLVVVGILAVLIGAMAAAINPMKQFAMANNARRWANIMNIMNAVSQNIVDNQGVFATSTAECGGDLPTSTTTMKKTGGYDICGCIVPGYIGSLPVDPTNGSPAGGVSSCAATYDTAYNIIYSTTTRRTTIIAPNAQSENGTAPTISLTR